MTVEIIIEYIKKPEIAAVILTAVFAVISRLLQPKARVIWGVGHQFCHNVPQSAGGSLNIYSRTISIKNNGKDTAKNVEIHFGRKPEHYQIWPPCNYSEEIFPDNHFMLSIEHLGKKEYINIELLQSAVELPLVLKLRTIDGDCKAVFMMPQQIFPTYVNLILISILFIGVYKVFELLLKFIF
jgi:hypothetical protein